MPPKSRLHRLTKLATLGAKLSTDVLTRGAKRLGGSDGSVLGAKAAETLVATLGDMKGLAMKLGQAMSMDPEMLTAEVRAVIAKLQNQAPPMEFSTVERVVRQELGRPIAELYASFDPKPMAAASLGQVHRAVTVDGREVAVKVQYPDVDQAVQADLSNLGSLVAVATTATRLTHGREYFDELKGELLSELDYRLEAERAGAFAKAVERAGLREIKVPEVLPALSARRVLTMELLPGPTLQSLLSQQPMAPNEERLRVSRLLNLAIWGPFLSGGVIHADPHPGNFLLMPDGRLGVLDFGAVKQLSLTFANVNRRLMVALVKKEPYDLVAFAREVGFDFSGVDEKELRAFVEGLMGIVCRFIATHDYDFGTDTAAKELRLHIMKNATKMTHVRPPREAMMFFRGVGGLSQNLQNLKARGDFLAMYEALMPLAER